MPELSASPSRSNRRDIVMSVLAVVFVQMVAFFEAIIRLQSNTGALDTKFKDVALERFMGYMAMLNVDLLRGYGLVAVLILLVCWPVMRWWTARKQKFGKWSVFWRMALLAFGVWVFFFLRFFYARPFYFTIDPSFQNLYFWVAGWLPDFLKYALFVILPWTVAGLTVVYYFSRGIRFFAKGWPMGACHAVSILLLVGVVLGVLGWSAHAERGQVVIKTDNRPNILILGSDSLRADHLSANGYERNTSPTIDALAAKSINFTRCLTPIASTVESITSMMTGQFPHTTGLQHMFPNKQQVARMKANSPQLAQILEKNGYSTSVLGDWCAGVFDLLELGFTHRDVSTFDNFQVYLTQAVYQEHVVLPLFFDNPVGYKLFPELRSCASFVTPEVVTERLKERITQESRNEKPFFIKAFYSTTHLPYAVNPPYSTKFTDPAYAGPHKGRMQLDIGEFIGSVDIADKWKKMPKEDVDQIVGLYDGAIAKFDDTVKDVLEHLKHSGVLDNTIVLITSDHGDDLFEPNCVFGHGLTFNGGDQNSHIPAILHVPGRGSAPTKIDKVVRSIDFAPTLLDLVGIPRDPRMEGVSLTPYIKNPQEDLSLAYFGETSYLFYKRYVPGEEPLYIPPMDETTEVATDFNCHFVLKDKYQDMVLATKERCLRTENWKVVFTPGKHHDIWRLFDLKNDPHCEVTVHLQRPEVFKPMQDALRSWMLEKREVRIRDIFPGGEPAGGPQVSLNDVR